MDPKEFLVLAQELAKPSANEAALRTCVSRSYYALFNAMARFINDEVESLSKSANDHTKVYQYFNNCGQNEVEQIASDLNDLRVERNNADYKLDEDRFDHFNASLLFKKASMAFNSFISIAGSSKRCKSVVRGIQAHKKRTNS